MDAIVKSIIMVLICLFTARYLVCDEGITSPTQFYNGMGPYVSSDCARFSVCDEGINQSYTVL